MTVCMMGSALPSKVGLRLTMLALEGNVERAPVASASPRGQGARDAGPMSGSYWEGPYRHYSAQASSRVGGSDWWWMLPLIAIATSLAVFLLLGTGSTGDARDQSQQQAGGPCRSDGDCEEGQLCVQSQCVANHRPCEASGNCRQTEACVEGRCTDVSCTPPCDTESGQVCLHGECQTRLGQPCGTTTQCAEEVCSEEECVPTQASCLQDTCVALPGAPCLHDSDCAQDTDMQAVRWACVESTCQKQGEGLSLGALCRFSESCQSNYCLPGQQGDLATVNHCRQEWRPGTDPRLPADRNNLYFCPEALPVEEEQGGCRQ